MTLLKFDEVIAKQDLETKDIFIPEWGGSVRVRPWTVAERNEFRRRATSAEDKDDVGAWLVSLLAVDENGKQWCPPDRIKELQQKHANAVQRIESGIMDLNKFDEKKFDDAAKNSQPNQSEPSSTS